MKRNIALFLVLVMSIVCLFIFAACGGEQGNTVEICVAVSDDWSRAPAEDPTSSDLEGTYQQVSFLYEYYEDGFLLDSIDENSGYSFSGTLEVNATTITKTTTLDGDHDTLTVAYTNSPIDSLSGVFTIDEDGLVYDVDYSISDGILTTYLMDCIDFSIGGLEAESLTVKEPVFGARLGPYGF